MIYIHLAICFYIATMSSLHIMILCIISAVVPSKKDFYMQVGVAVTPYIFGCSSIFGKINVANIS